MTADELVVDALAAFRLTRLITKDRAARSVRESWIEAAYLDAEAAPKGSDRFGPGEWTAWAVDDEDVPALAEFVICPWCVGLWLAAGVAVARAVAPRAWGPLARVLAFNAATGLLATR